jgi:hypothetical protein
MNFLVLPSRTANTTSSTTSVTFASPNAKPRLKNTAQRRQDQQRGEHCRRDERHFAFRFQKANQSADQQQDDVSPQNFDREIVHARRLPQFPDTSRLKISPGSHVTVTSKGRQHTSQSVVNRWLGTLVSMATSDACPQNGQEMDSQTSTRKI